MKRKWLLMGCGLFFLHASSQEIRIGMVCPDASFSSVLHIPDGTATLSQWKGKPLLIGFWNTHCAISREVLPQLSGLQQQFGGNLQVLLVAGEPQDIVRQTLRDVRRLRKIALPIATGDTAFRKQFPHRIQPHFVWVSAGGKVMGITGHEAITPENVRALSRGDEVVLPLKKDIIDPAILYSLNPLMNDTDPESQSRLGIAAYVGSYRPGIAALIRAASYRPEDNTVRLTAVNQPLSRLYQLAYRQFAAFHRNRFLLEGELLFENKSREDTLFCYDLLLRDTSLRKAYRWMQQDLDRYFGVRSVFRKQRQTVLVLRRIGKGKNFSAKPHRTPDVYEADGMLVCQNVPLPRFIDYTLNSRSLLPYPVVNETGIEQAVDLVLSTRFDEIGAVQASLRLYGLDLTKEVREVEIIRLQKGKNPALGERD